MIAGQLRPCTYLLSEKNEQNAAHNGQSVASLASLMMHETYQRNCSEYLYTIHNTHHLKLPTIMNFSSPDPMLWHFKCTQQSSIHEKEENRTELRNEDSSPCIGVIYLNLSCLSLNPVIWMFTCTQTYSSGWLGNLYNNEVVTSPYTVL